MLYLSQAIGLATLVLWLYCLFDALTTPDAACRNLPKILWVVVVLLFPLIGSIAWLVAGRPERAPRAPARPGAFPEDGRPGRSAATHPDDDEEFLRRCRERAEEQRRNAPKKPPED
ncbi:MAG TPA: PLD nuclease N-terminal domain-containing protein [Nonomuraea sp.]|nr:PLD nuclease N-terminal domain-containing protein [Nonomuraea sp.]